MRRKSSAGRSVLLAITSGSRPAIGRSEVPIASGFGGEMGSLISSGLQRARTSRVCLSAAEKHIAAPQLGTFSRSRRTGHHHRSAERHQLVGQSAGSAHADRVIGRPLPDIKQIGALAVRGRCRGRRSIVRHRRKPPGRSTPIRRHESASSCRGATSEFSRHSSMRLSPERRWRSRGAVLSGGGGTRTPCLRHRRRRRSTVHRWRHRT